MPNTDKCVSVGYYVRDGTSAHVGKPGFEQHLAPIQIGGTKLLLSTITLQIYFTFRYRYTHTYILSGYQRNIYHKIERLLYSRAVVFNFSNLSTLSLPIYSIQQFIFSTRKDFSVKKKNVCHIETAAPVHTCHKCSPRTELIPFVFITSSMGITEFQ